MRLLNCHTLQLEQYLGDIPPYAILSHRWLEADAEPTYQDLQKGIATHKKGFHKIQLASTQALRDHISYLWADTICIDKTNHVEFSEAINSMYRYYAHAQVCFAYLADVQDMSQFNSSIWFARAWTLQELLAPPEVIFYSQAWELLGARTDPAMYPDLWTATGIGSVNVFVSFNPKDWLVAQRMSWASRRTATRVEDTAYCMLGIFQVSMPLLYGEGDNAFRRLQEEIMRTSDDRSLFAWESGENTRGSFHGLIARHPSSFASWIDGQKAFLHEGPGWIRQIPWHTYHWRPPTSTLIKEAATPWSLTNLGIQISLPLAQIRNIPNTYFALLGYDGYEEHRQSPAIIVFRTGNNRFSRIFAGTLLFPDEAWSRTVMLFWGMDPDSWIQTKLPEYNIEQMIIQEQTMFSRDVLLKKEHLLNDLQMEMAGFSIQRLYSAKDESSKELPKYYSKTGAPILSITHYSHAKHSVAVVLCVDREARAALYPAEVELDPDAPLRAIFDADRDLEDETFDYGGPEELILRSKDDFDIFLRFSAYTINENMMQSSAEVLMSSFHSRWSYEPPYTVMMQVTDVAKWSQILGQRTVLMLNKLPTYLEVIASSIRVFNSPLVRGLFTKHPAIATSAVGLAISGVRPSAGWLEDLFTRGLKKSALVLSPSVGTLFTRSSDGTSGEVRQRTEHQGSEEIGSNGIQGLDLDFDPHLAYG